MVHGISATVMANGATPQIEHFPDLRTLIGHSGCNNIDASTDALRNLEAASQMNTSSFKNEMN